MTYALIAAIEAQARRYGWANAADYCEARMIVAHGGKQLMFWSRMELLCLGVAP